MKKTLFLCSANVGRSQIAEGYYSHITGKGMGLSAALVENKISNYNGCPDKEVIQSMSELGIDISHQRIKLLSEEACYHAERIVLLLKDETKKCEFLINGEVPLQFLERKFSEKILYRPIKDPYGEGIEAIVKARNDVILMINKLSVN